MGIFLVKVNPHADFGILLALVLGLEVVDRPIRPMLSSHVLFIDCNGDCRQIMIYLQTGDASHGLTSGRSQWIGPMMKILCNVIMRLPCVHYTIMLHYQSHMSMIKLWNLMCKG